MDIRTKITSQDFYDMRHCINWKDASIKQLEKALDNSMIVVGIYEDDKIVAMGRLVGDYSFKALLSDIIVRPEYQKKGYGKKIVLKILEVAKENMNEGEILCIEGQPTNGNIEFYLKCGFKHELDIQEGIYMWIKK